MFQIEVVDLLQNQPCDPALVGAHLDRPRLGDQRNVYTIEVAGWVLGRDAPATEIEFICDGIVVTKCTVALSRPDIAAAFPAFPDAKASGFRHEVSLFGAQKNSSILVYATLGGGSRILIGTIKTTQSRGVSQFEPKLQPLLVTSLGRTGTTWLMRLLAAHPQIVAHRLYPYECRSAAYWMHMLKVLSQPADYVRSAHPDTFQYNSDWVGHHPFYTNNIQLPAPAARWLGDDYLVELAEFCQGCIDSFYLAVARAQEQGAPVFFVEKFTPGHLPPLILEVYPKAREIFLVRDFRDMFSSMVAFNERRGSASFGRNLVNTDEEHLQPLRQSALALLTSWQRRSKSSHLVRYESLIRQPMETLHVMLEYLDLDCGAPVVAEMIAKASMDDAALRRHRTSVDPTASIGRWKRDLNATLKDACADAFGDVLEQFGYEQ